MNNPTTNRPLLAVLMAFAIVCGFVDDSHAQAFPPRGDTHGKFLLTYRSSLVSGRDPESRIQIADFVGFMIDSMGMQEVATIKAKHGGRTTLLVESRNVNGRYNRRAARSFSRYISLHRAAGFSVDLAAINTISNRRTSCVSYYETASADQRTLCFKLP